MSARERVSRTAFVDDDDEVTNLEKGLKIDEHALDDALIEQPGMFYNVAKSLAIAISRRDAAKQEVQTVEAKVDSEVRADASAAGEKTTETGVANAVRIDDRVAEVKAKLLKKDLRVAELTALRDAFMQRSYALKDLISLYLASYYSDPNDARPNSSVTELRSREAKKHMDRARRNRD